jgi:hypothetical protein
MCRLCPSCLFALEFHLSRNTSQLPLRSRAPRPSCRFAQMSLCVPTEFPPQMLWRTPTEPPPPPSGSVPALPLECAGPTSQMPLCDQRLGREPTPRMLTMFPPLLRRCPLQRASQIPASYAYSILLMVWHPYRDCSVPRRCRFAAGDSDANHSGRVQSGGSLDCRAGRVGQGRSPYKPLRRQLQPALTGVGPASEPLTPAWLGGSCVLVSKWS